jgi:CRP-like cAMP-binding protein
VSGMVEVRFEAGTELFKAGEPADRLYIVKEGTIDLIDSSTGKVFASLGAGAPFGEQAVLAGGVRSATARAREASVCMEITADGLQRILEDERDLVRVLFRATLLQLYMNNALMQVR